MSNVATTFRFPDEVREELDTIKEQLGASTLQKTVEMLIMSHRKREALLSETNNRARKAESERQMYLSRLRAIKGAFNIILEYRIDEE